MSTHSIDNLSSALSRICAEYRVHRLRIFGSVMRGDARPDSDVDLLVDYEPGYTPTFYGMESFEQDLSGLFDGRRVDLMRPDDVHWFIRSAVLSSARVLYER